MIKKRSPSISFRPVNSVENSYVSYVHRLVSRMDLVRHRRIQRPMNISWLLCRLMMEIKTVPE